MDDPLTGAMKDITGEVQTVGICCDFVQVIYHVFLP